MKDLIALILMGASISLAGAMLLLLNKWNPTTLKEMFGVVFFGSGILIGLGSILLTVLSLLMLAFGA